MATDEPPVANEQTDFSGALYVTRSLTPFVPYVAVYPLVYESTAVRRPNTTDVVLAHIKDCCGKSVNRTEMYTDSAEVMIPMMEALTEYAPAGAAPIDKEVNPEANTDVSNVPSVLMRAIMILELSAEVPTRSGRPPASKRIENRASNASPALVMAVRVTTPVLLMRKMS